MKRTGDLWPQLTSFANLLHAAERASAGKRRRPGVADFLLNLEPELLALRRELLSGSYQPGAYRTFLIRDPKPRQISAAPFRDRVVHHALTQVLEPVFESRFSPNSFACRTGLGTHAALRRARAGIEQYSHCLKCDIRKYFASIDHEILSAHLARAVKCKPTLHLAATIIAGSNPQEEFAPYFPGDNLFSPFERRRGLPLGNQTSQFFANVYLNGLDQKIDRTFRVPVYARYVDDFVLFDNSRERLSDLRFAIEEHLQSIRPLLHSGKSRVYPSADGVTFLGWRLFPTHTRLARANVIRFQRRMRGLQHDVASGLVPLEQAGESVRAWIAHASFGDTTVLRSRMLNRYPFRATKGVKP